MEKILIEKKLLVSIEELLSEFVGDVPLTDDDWEYEHGVLAELRQALGQDITKCN